MSNCSKKMENQKQSVWHVYVKKYKFIKATFAKHLFNDG